MNQKTKAICAFLILVVVVALVGWQLYLLALTRPALTFSVSREDPNASGVGSMDIDVLGYKGWCVSGATVKVWADGSTTVTTKTTDQYGNCVFYIDIGLWHWEVVGVTSGLIRVNEIIGYHIFCDVDRGLLLIDPPPPPLDNVPPTLSNPYPSGNETNPTELKIGDTIKIKATVTDDGSGYTTGVKMVLCNILDMTEGPPYRGILTKEGTPHYLQPAGGDVWEIDWTVPSSYTYGGQTYVLSDGSKLKFYFASWDNVDNIGDASTATTYAVTRLFIGVSIPPPIKDVWTSLNAVWQQFVDWVKDIISKLFPMQISPLSLYGGDVVQETITLTNKKTTSIPDSDYSDGTASYTYKLWMVLDSSGNIVYKGSVIEISSLAAGATTSVSPSWTVPKDLPQGTYVLTGCLVEIPMHFDKTTGVWIEDQAVVIDKQGIELDIKQIGAPPPPTDLWGQLAQLWQQFIDWIKSLWPFITIPFLSFS